MSNAQQNSDDNTRGSGLAALPHAIINDEHLTIQSISEVIYPLFDIEGGTLKMAGCSIEESPILRIDTSLSATPLFFAETGTLDCDLAKSLKLDCATAIENEPEWLKSPNKRDQLDTLLSAARSFVVEENIEPRRLSVVWCKHVDGKLAIEIGNETRFVKFSGWLQRLVDGLEKCPPYFCELTGKSSYSISTDDDGTISVAAAIGTCDISGKRLVETKMGTCSATGRLVDLEKLWACPITHELLLEEEAVRCNSCNQKVSPAAVAKGRCQVCRQVVAADESDPAVDLVISKHDRLKYVRNFKTASCLGFTVVVCRLKMTRYLFVIDNDRNDIVECRKSSLFGLSWNSINSDSVS